MMCRYYNSFRKIVTIVLLFVLTTFLSFAQTVQVNENLSITQLSDRIYTYTAWAEMGSWGRVGSNGVVVIGATDAILLDTPVSESQTVELIEWIKSTTKSPITYFVPNHWHEDCVGGLEYLNKRGVKSYANHLTNELLKKKNLPVAKESFNDSLTIDLGNVSVVCYFLGGGHSTDNIVVWIPSAKVLFGGCMLKEIRSSSIGNTSDAAPLNEWLNTVKTVETKFHDAKIVIPGHGNIGGKEIISHTEAVIKKHIRQQ
ncbi:MAG: subclass B1 metallo-beta-lactamase [Bacteroidales bacterium]